MLDSPVTCPNCCAQHIVKNGRIHNGKQNFKCRAYGRQFVQNPENKIIDQNTKDLIDKLLLEKLPLAGITRVTGFPGFDVEFSRNERQPTGVSERWLQTYFNQAINGRRTPPVYCRAKYEAAPQQVSSRTQKRGG